MSTQQPHSYPQIAEDATLRLHSFLQQLIHDQGAIPFNTFMHHALYHPDWGYYNQGAQRLGKSGDYITSVSIGKAFGTILAYRIHSEWLAQEKPSTFHLIEIGANNGQLACDILDTLEPSFPELYSTVHYHICEHLASAQHNQKITLKHHQEKLQHFNHIGEISLANSNGIILSNELIDALPVHLLHFDKPTESFLERTITLDDEQQFTYQLDQIDAEKNPDLVSFIQQIDTIQLPDGYQTEYRPGIETLTQNLSNALTHSLIISIDYGHTHQSYYHPSRSTGTLRCYHNHVADEDPLQLPGQKDITAHADFTQLANAFIQADQHPCYFGSQANYLTTHAKNWLLKLEENFHASETPALIKQFQTLTHPTTFGHQFHILETHSHRDTDPVTLERLEIS